MHQTIQMLEQIHRRADLPDFHPGDTIKVWVRVREGDKERLQVFEGYVIGRKGAGIHETFTVRKISYGIGVERVFPIHSPMISRMEVVAKGRVRRAKLNYLRALKGKAAKISERKSWMVAAIGNKDDVAEPAAE
jgi:large subunit ribosomal protein L19